jgi:hypothetical protein
VAEQFQGRGANPIVDESLSENGFTQIWTTDRPIHWHRNHGYARLKKERVDRFTLKQNGLSALSATPSSMLDCGSEWF